jgi:exosome complex RNA-binding protein Rrp4
MNGIIWIRSPDPMITIIIRNAILNSQYIQSNEIESMVDELAKRYSKR